MKRKLVDWYVGTDIGGTFTDVVFFDSDTKQLKVAKLPTSKEKPDEVILEALRDLSADPRRVFQINHATTLATNCLLTHTGLAKTALITNHGFRDILEIGRQRRAELYNLLVTRPPPLVARADRFVVRGRILSNGSELEPLSKNDSTDVARRIVREKFESVAIAFINSYVNPRHEKQMERVLKKNGFHGSVSLSSNVDRQYREYERTSTTVVNACLSPLMSKYLNNFQTNLRCVGFNAPLYIMGSDGNVVTVNTATKYPICAIESGPAAGVLASRHLAEILSLDKVMTFDMGGTTAKVGTIVQFSPDISYEFEAAGKAHSGRSVKGSGYAVRYPFIDLAEVSAGGGTIARVDEGGELKVGPRSAGSEPGPASYGKGGQEPTITDANIVVGRLNPVHLLSGRLQLHSTLAFKSIREKLSKKMGTSVRKAAQSIIVIANHSMAKAASIVSLERGRDPRDYALFAFGGAGPLHACDLAEEMGINKIVVPVHPGLFSAYGLLTADLARSFSTPVMSTNFSLGSIFRELAKNAKTVLQGEGFTNYRVQRSVDVRFVGQSYELSLHYKENADLKKEFQKKHAELYGYSSNDPVEIVNARIRAIIKIPKASSPKSKISSRPAQSANNKRKVWFGGTYAVASVYERDELSPGDFEHGPCVIEEYDSTTAVGIKWAWAIDEHNNIKLTRE